MKTIIYLSFFTFVLSVHQGCGDYFGKDQALEEQLIYFQYEYVNHAWGYAHHGFFIDSTGNVWYYEQPENWEFNDSSDLLSQEELKEKLLLADSLLTHIDVSLLEEKTAMIRGAATGKLAKPEQVMADAGTMAYYAYILNIEEGLYERILLRQNGDWQIINKSDEAEELYEWMKSIRE